MLDQVLQQRPALRARVSSVIRVVLTIVLFAAVICLALRLTLLLRFEPFRRTMIWTPGAVLFTALLIAPPRRWWIYYAGFCLGAVGAYFDDEAIPSSHVMFVVQFLFSTTALGAWVIRRSRNSFSLANPETFVWFVAWAVAIVPITTEASQVLVLFASGATDVWAAALHNVLSIALGVLCGTPALTLTLINGHAWLRAGSWKRFLEIGALAACLVTV